MTSLTLPIFQIVVSMIPFLVYTEFYFLILAFCLPNSSTTTCYTLFGILGVLSLLSILSLIESAVTVDQITKIRRGDQDNYPYRPQAVIIVLNSLILLINIVMIGITIFIKDFSFLDGIWWGYFGAGAYQMILIILAVKIMKDINEAKSGEEWGLLRVTKI